MHKHQTHKNTSDTIIDKQKASKVKKNQTKHYGTKHPPKHLVLGTTPCLSCLVNSMKCHFSCCHQLTIGDCQFWVWDKGSQFPLNAGTPLAWTFVGPVHATSLCISLWGQMCIHPASWRPCFLGVFYPMIFLPRLLHTPLRPESQSCVAEFLTTEQSLLLQGHLNSLLTFCFV